MRTTPAITYSRHTTIQCKRTRTTSYVQSTLHTPTHCSCCTNSSTNSKLRIDSTSELDEFAIRYGLHPKVAHTINALTDKHNAGHYSTSLHSKHLTISQFAEQQLKLIPTPITPLNLHCLSCGSTYTLIRTTPTTQKTPPLHCVYCASTNIGLIQADPEQTAFISLALHYNLPLQTLKSLYNFWSQRPNYPTFAQFMQSDTMAQIRPILEASITQQGAVN